MLLFRQKYMIESADSFQGFLILAPDGFFLLTKISGATRKLNAKLVRLQISTILPGSWSGSLATVG
ncbi:hypothetical protein DZC30_05055 [Comamonas testosteroni]|uniref:Uncharacterized protein n=1 Tax=Comamonas testosteroni TaxID=285 RepID=A0A373FRY3_COMTE|nr:hypothetical protein DZC30_05055 [Comamonas testosteroni]